jgi:Mn2+/Fe2+ NRAMP family transporter
MGIGAWVCRWTLRRPQRASASADLDPVITPKQTFQTTDTLAPPRRGFLAALGPGLLFAGAAVGVSHLVQSTRAGAAFGLSMLAVVILANAMKFPAFRFGPHYAAATGESLVEGYRRQGRWVLVAFALLTLATMFTVTAVVTVTTAGVTIAVLGLGALLEATVGTANGPAAVSALLLTLSAVLLAVGGYVWLDRFIKVVMPILVVATIAATVLTLGRIEWGQAQWFPTAAMLDTAGLLFMVALIGWMPSAVDISVWSSLWTLARARHQGRRPDLPSVLREFDAGYLGTTLLALMFVLLGTGLMFGQGLSFADGAAPFAAQVVDLYAVSLGEWSRPVIGGAALLVMLSTTVTVVDAFPRVVAAVIAQFRNPRGGDAAAAVSGEGDRRIYRWSFLLLCGGALVILVWGMRSFTALVDLATTLSFVTAPVLSFINHRAVFGPAVPPPLRPSRAMGVWSGVSIALQGAFALLFLWIRFGPGA